jgi:hypothetical protein
MSDAGDQRTLTPKTDAWDSLRWWGAAVASLGWLAVFAYSASSRGDVLGFDFMLVIAWLIASLGLAGFWIVVFIVAIRAWMSRNTELARRATAFLLPFVAAAILALVLGRSDMPLRTRFRLSEGSLNRLADEYEQTGSTDASGWVGLYLVDGIHRYGNCTAIVTGRFIFDEFGFARCSGPPPGQNNPWNLTLEHLKGDWWTYQDRD